MYATLSEDELWKLARRNVRLYRLSLVGIKALEATLTDVPAYERYQRACDLHRAYQYQNAIIARRLKKALQFDQAAYDALINGAELELASEGK